MEKIRVDFKKMYYGFPVILISYYDKNGNPNITTLTSSFTLSNMVCLGFGSKSYAVNEIKKIKDFVINVPDKTMMRQIDICGSLSGREIDKFKLTGFTPVKSELVNAPMISECKVAIECSLTDVLEIDYFKGITTILAKIKGRCIDKGLLNEEGNLINSSLDSVLYVGDTAQRTYRYTEANKSNQSGSFI